MSSVTKNTRIDIRINSEDKKLLEKAAAIKRMSLSTFMLSSAIEEAKRIISKEELIIIASKNPEILEILSGKSVEPNKELIELLSKRNKDVLK